MHDTPLSERIARARVTSHEKLSTLSLFQEGRPHTYLRSQVEALLRDPACSSFD
jgi:hypothetical protein